LSCLRSRSTAAGPAQENHPAKGRDSYRLGHILFAEPFIDGEGFGLLARCGELLGALQATIGDGYLLKNRGFVPSDPQRLGGCRTEQTKKIEEVERTGDQVKVKKIETHKDKHGTTKKIETKEYEDD